MVDKLSNTELLEKVWNSSIDGMVLSDKNGIVIKANQQYYNIYGYSENEIVGQNFAIIFSVEQREIVNQQYQELFNCQDIPPKFESQIQRKDGTFRIVLSRIEFIYHNNEKIALLSVITDITEQKNYEKQILEQNEILKLAFDNEKVAWWDWDYESGNVKYSPNKATIIGYSVEEFPINVYKICDLIHPDDYEPTMKLMVEHLQGKKQYYEVIYRIKTKTNTYNYYYDFGKIIERTSDGKPKRLFGIVFNINQQKEIEIQLSQSEEKYKLIAENTSDGIFIADANGKITYVSVSYCKQLGYTEQEELLNTTKEIYNLIHPDERDELFSKIYKEIEEQKTDLIYNFRAKHKNGHYIWREDHAKYNYDKQGKLLFSTVICRDITERKTYENELIASKVKAEESDHLKSAFLRNISHEIRTPMNAICGFSDMLLKPNLSYEKQKQFTDIVHKSVNQLLSVIENTITISHIETNQLKINTIEFNPNKLILELFDEYELHKTKIEKTHIELQHKIDNQTSIVLINDYSRLKQIFKILIDNSFKFTEQGKIEFGYSITDNQINFYVIDTGLGIPKDKQEIIFKSFAQADDTIRTLFGGVGLGLSIAVGLIKLIGGQLTINSEENKGTEISFSLPIENIESSINQNIEPNKKGLENSIILVAEDEDFNFDYIEELLSETNIKIVRAINGQKAVEICKSQNVDIILMDIKMPIMNGFEATNEIRKFSKTVPIIAQTAYSYKREDCINSGFTDYIAKPFNDEQLIKIIKQYIDNE